MTVDYKTIGNAIQLNGSTAIVDTDFVESQGMQSEDSISRMEGITLFNDIAKSNGLNELQDPRGYMTLDNNVYDAIHNAYENQYTEAVNRIDTGMMAGGTYGMVAVLNTLKPTIRHDITPYMPSDVKYSELRFVQASPEIKETINDYVSSRVRLTHAFGIKRSIEQSTFNEIKDSMKLHGDKFKHQVAVSMGLATESRKLSKTELLMNSKSNYEGYEAFEEMISNPSDIKLVDEKNNLHVSGNAVATHETTDKNAAKFLLSNKKYLNNFGFDVVKGRGKVTVSWQSPLVDVMYKERQESADLDMSDLGESLQQ